MGAGLEPCKLVYFKGCYNPQSEAQLTSASPEIAAAGRQLRRAAAAAVAAHCRLRAVSIRLGAPPAGCGHGPAARPAIETAGPAGCARRPPHEAQTACSNMDGSRQLLRPGDGGLSCSDRP